MTKKREKKTNNLRKLSSFRFQLETNMLQS